MGPTYPRDYTLPFCGLTPYPPLSSPLVCTSFFSDCEFGVVVIYSCDFVPFRSELPVALSRRIFSLTIRPIPSTSRYVSSRVVLVLCFQSSPLPPSQRSEQTLEFSSSSPPPLLLFYFGRPTFALFATLGGLVHAFLLQDLPQARIKVPPR